MEQTGWIKLHRKLLGWEWFTDINTCHLFLYLLLKANHKDRSWRGEEILAGQLITSVARIKSETGLSAQQIRTSLGKLKLTKEITIKSTNKFTCLTICNYDTYQVSETVTNKQNNKQTTKKQQTNNKQTTTNNNIKNDNNKNKNIFNFKNELLKLDIEEQIVEDYLKARKTKKATNSETAFNAIIREIEKSGQTASECIRLAAEKGWAGFKAEWIDNLNTNNHGKIGTSGKTSIERRKEQNAKTGQHIITRLMQ